MEIEGENEGSAPSTRVPDQRFVNYFSDFTRAFDRGQHTIMYVIMLLLYKI